MLRKIQHKHTPFTNHQNAHPVGSDTFTVLWTPFYHFPRKNDYIANVTKVPDIWNIFEEVYSVSQMTCNRRWWKQTNPKTVGGLEQKAGAGQEQQKWKGRG